MTAIALRRVFSLEAGEQLRRKTSQLAVLAEQFAVTVAELADAIEAVDTNRTARDGLVRGPTLGGDLVFGPDAVPEGLPVRRSGIGRGSGAAIRCWSSL
jgi:hypothetical protein